MKRRDPFRARSIPRECGRAVARDTACAKGVAHAHMPALAARECVVCRRRDGARIPRKKFASAGARGTILGYTELSPNTSEAFGLTANVLLDRFRLRGWQRP